MKINQVILVRKNIHKKLRTKIKIFYSRDFYFCDSKFSMISCNFFILEKKKINSKLNIKCCKIFPLSHTYRVHSSKAARAVLWLAQRNDSLAPRSRVSSINSIIKSIFFSIRKRSRLKRNPTKNFNYSHIGVNRYRTVWRFKGQVNSRARIYFEKWGAK